MLKVTIKTSQGEEYNTVVCNTFGCPKSAIRSIRIREVK